MASQDRKTPSKRKGRQPQSGRKEKLKKISEQDPQDNLPNMEFQGMAGSTSDHPNQGVLPPQGRSPMMVMFQEEQEKIPTMEPINPELKKTIEEVLCFTMKDDWNTVVNIYKNPDIQKTIISDSKGTVLHMAVNSGRTDIVEKLVAELTDSRILDIMNKVGNTAIHLAAIAGDEKMCQCMVEKRPQLVVKPNKMGETPLFAAVTNGRKNAFLYLNSKCDQVDGYAHLIRSSDNQNILHSAIEREHFDLAYEIIKRYNKDVKLDWDLANFLDVKGLSALYLLASRPFAFKSGSQLGIFNRLLYDCIVVDPLEETSLDSIPSNGSQSKHNIQSSGNYPAFLKWLCSWASWRSPPNQRDKENPHDVRSGSTFPQWLWWWRLSPQKQRDEENPHDIRFEPTDGGASGSRNNQREGGSHEYHKHSFSLIYIMCYYSSKLALVVLRFLVHAGFINTGEIKKEKEKHTWAVQIMEELVSQSSRWRYDPKYLNRRGESPFLMASRMGVVEMVEKILDVFPVAIRDVDNYDHDNASNVLPYAAKNRKHKIFKIISESDVDYYDLDNASNVLHYALKNRKHKIFKIISDRCRKSTLDELFRRCDRQVNTPLHLAAVLNPRIQPWPTSSAVLQILLEINWFKMVSNIKPPELGVYRNGFLQTAKDIFTTTHKDMIKQGADELTRMANSCSVVAALIATVAFATAATIPGGFLSENGTPMFEGEIAFYVFTISSFIALCASIISVITFLAILNYPYQETDFGRYLPCKMIIGFTSLLLSIAFMFASFCASHFFLLKDKLHHSMAYPLYVIVCILITLFSIRQFPLYFDIIKYSITKGLPDN